MIEASYTDRRYNKYLPQWRKLRDFKEGINDVKKHLWRWELEDDDGYEQRQNRAVLYNMVKIVVKGSNGLLFAKPLTYDNLNKDFDNKAKDIDGNNTSLNSFFKRASELALWYGVAYIVIDFPYNDEIIVNKQQQIQKGIVPYFSVVTPLDVPNFRYENQELTQLTIKSIELVNDGEFREKEVERYRVFRKGSITIYEDEKAPIEILTGLDFIPIVPLYTNKEGNFNGVPRFESLADMNIKHFNYESQLDKAFFYANNPVGKIYGQQNDENVIIGVDRALSFTSKEEGDFQWEEAKGTGIAGMQNKLDKIQDQMIDLGLSVAKDKEMTATEKAINTAIENADLSAIAEDISETATTCYRYWCDMMGAKYGDEEIKINNNFTKLMLSPSDASFYLDAYAKGSITRERFWTELQNRGVLGEFDAEKEKAELEANKDDVEL